MKPFSSSYFQNAGYKTTLGLLENFLESSQNNALLTILFISSNVAYTGY